MSINIMITEAFNDLAEDECGPKAGVTTSAGH
jgi:hypothetical protein